MTSEHHQRFPKISRECQMWQYKAPNLGTTLPRSRISILGEITEARYQEICLGKKTVLVNFQVNGYGTSEIVLYASHVIGVFDPQACDTSVMHVRWQYIVLPLTKFDRKFSLLVNACLSHNRQIKNCF